MGIQKLPKGENGTWAASFRKVAIGYSVSIISYIVSLLLAVSYSQIHPALQQIPAHSSLELCL